MGHNVYRATDYDILPLNPDISVQSPPNAVEAHLLALVRSHLYGGYFLYSYGWDLTRRLQAQWETLQSDQGKALWETVSSFHGESVSTAQLSSFRPTTVSFGTSVSAPPHTHSYALTHASRYLQSRFIDVTYSSGDQNVSCNIKCIVLSCTHDSQLSPYILPIIYGSECSWLVHHS